MKLILLLPLFFSAGLLAGQQLCQGNLGENIFDQGDFGSGAPNVPAADPGIAPGYTYTSSVPPPDGFYTLTNDSDWPNAYGTWLTIPDNSNDPNGYFMVVNASFEPGLFYEQTIDGLCENTLYVFTADIINMIQQGTADHLKPNVTFLLNGVEQYGTGEIPENNSWNTYGFTFTTAPGQTTLTLALRNNAPGGIGNDLGLDNITFQACGPLAQILPETIERICEDGQFTNLDATIDGDQYPTPAVQWQRSLDAGTTWEDIPGETDLTYVHTDLSSGFYYYRYLLANSPANLSSTKCRVVSNVKVVEVVPKRWMITDTICQGLTYVTGNSAYTQTGIYLDSLISSLGCDSIVTLDLTVVTDPGLEADLTVDHPACLDGLGRILVDTVRNGFVPYTYRLSNRDTVLNGGPAFSGLAPGSYQFTVEDRHGCAVTVDSTVNPPREFFLELGNDQSIPLGETARINVIATDEIGTYAWTPEIPGCGVNCDNPVFVPATSMTYRLDALSVSGCAASDSIRIGVQKIRQVYLPNAFSPNGDGINDHFLPLVNQPNVQGILSLQVFNRWGGLVYEGTALEPGNLEAGWDGSRDGQPADEGIYVFTARLLFLDGEVIDYSGDVMLVR